MSFQPVVPLQGYAGWTFLQRTLDQQTAAFERSAPIVRATDYFREKIGGITTAEDLVADRRLLQVALGAFDLDEDIGNTYFIQKILEDGTNDPDALANRLADKRYFAFALEFGLGTGEVARTNLTFFADRIISRFEEKQFARAVGETAPDMRLALNVEDGVSDILGNTSGEDARWFAMMGNAPLRRVFETAMGLPTSMGRLDLDQQLTAFKDRSRSNFGTESIADFTKPERQDDLIRLFLVRSQVSAFSGLSGGSAALTLLQSAPAIQQDRLFG